MFVGTRLELNRLTWTRSPFYKTNAAVTVIITGVALPLTITGA